MSELRVVGKSMDRVDGIEKAMGRAVFGNDIVLPGMLHAKVLRSPHPHARILKINTEKARQLKGVKAVITSKDINDHRHGAGLRDQTILAKEVVRYVGEAVAAVAAETIKIAEEALGLIEVEYEQLPAVFDVEEAFQENPAVVVHPDLPEYDCSPNMPPKLISERPNVYHHHKVHSGNVDKAFKQADYIIENRYTSPALQHVQMEPHCAVARAEADGTLTIWGSIKTITGVRTFLSTALDIPVSRIRMIVPYVGGDFGGKQDIQCMGITSVLSMITDRPVKLAFTREEVFHCATIRFPSVITIKDGVKADGTLLAREMTVLQNGGAYADYGFLTVRNCMFAATGTYKIPNFRFASYGVYTNLPKSGAFRGFGNPQVGWAVELQMEKIAQKLNFDPVEFRRKNLLHEGDISPVGEKMFSVGISGCLDKAVEAIGYKKGALSWQEGKWKKGIGIAIGNKYSIAPTAACASVRAREDGKLDVMVCIDETGQGATTVLRQIAAEEMGLEVSDVRLLYENSDFTSFDEGAISSRTTYNTGNAICLACLDLKNQIRAKASEKMGIPAEKLKVNSNRIYDQDNPDNFILISDLFKYNRLATGRYIAEGGDLIGKATWEQGCLPEDKNGLSERLNAFFTHGAHAVQVAVHQETGQVKVEKIIGVFDMGTAVNPLLCQGQIEGGAVMGLGGALFDELIYDKQGRTVNQNLTNYLVPTVLDVPKVENFQSYIVEAPHRDGPFGAKGLGEGTMVSATPAVSLAIFNAVGLWCNYIPVKYEQIREALTQ